MSKSLLYPMLLPMAIQLGCNKSESLSSMFDGKDEYLQSEVCKIESDDILMPLYFACSDNLLICANYSNAKKLRVYDLRTGEVINDIIETGNGPQELLDITSFYSTEEEIVVYSSNSQRIVKIPFEELTNISPSIEEISFSYRLMRLTYSYV